MSCNAPSCETKTYLGIELTTENGACNEISERLVSTILNDKLRLFFLKKQANATHRRSLQVDEQTGGQTDENGT